MNSICVVKANRVSDWLCQRIGRGMAFSRMSEPVLLPYEYLEALCQYSMISLTEETETSG